MTRKQRSAEIVELREMCVAILSAGAGGDIQALLISGTNQVADAGNLRGLREFFKDCVEMTDNLSSDARAALDQRLRDRFGRGLDDQRAKNEKLVEAVRRRGAVRTENEYREVERYIDQILQDSEKDELRYELQALLTQAFGVTQTPSGERRDE